MVKYYEGGDFMKKEIENRAYDIIINGANQVVILKYKVLDTEYRDHHKQRNYYRKYLYLGMEIPDDIEASICHLQSLGYLHINHFKPADFNVLTNHPLVQIKLMLLARNHKILEKVYGEEIVDDINHIVSYITYVDMRTGEISFMKVADLGVYSDEIISDAEYFGYKSYHKSFYYQWENSEQKKR